MDGRGRRAQSSSIRSSAALSNGEERSYGWPRPNIRNTAPDLARRRRTGDQRGFLRKYTFMAHIENVVDYIKCSLFNAWENYLDGDCKLRTSQMDRLRQHTYNVVDISWLDEFCMKKFWDFMIEFYPMWLAPNLITLVGFTINLLTVLVLSCFSHDARNPAPSWAYFQAALGLFFYQTLDATDGKQARRTGSSSPLGELFDHGCDAVSQVFVTLNVCYAMLVGEDRYLVLVVIVLSISLFYCAHWSTYCTGRMKFAKFDVTEAQMTIIVILLLSAIFGTGLWTQKILYISLKYVLIFASGIVCFTQMINYLIDVFTGGIGKNGSTVAGTSVLSPLIPLMLVTTPFCMVYSKCKTSVYDDNITMFALCFGAVSAKATVRLVIAHMSRSKLAMWDWIYLCPLMMMLNQYYDVRVDEFYLLIFATIYAYASLSLYSVMICRQLCGFLRINCFSLQPRAADEKCD